MTRQAFAGIWYKLSVRRLVAMSFLDKAMMSQIDKNPHQEVELSFATTIRYVANQCGICGRPIYEHDFMAGFTRMVGSTHVCPRCVRHRKDKSLEEIQARINKLRECK